MCRAIGMCGNSTEPRGNSGSSIGMTPQRCSGGAAVLGVLDDAFAARLTRAPAVPEGDLDADLVLAHEVVADRAAQVGDDVLLGRYSLGLLDGVGHVPFCLLELLGIRLYPA